MWFLWQLLHQTDVLFTTNECSNQYPASAGEITLKLLIQSTSLWAFWAMGKTHKSKAQCSACPSLCARLGSQAAHQKQTLGQTELFIQLYTLFGGCMSFSDWETICCVSWWITYFELWSSEAGGIYFQFLKATGFFLRSTHRQDTPIKLLIIPPGQLSHSWTSSWPSKAEELLRISLPKMNINTAYFYLHFPPQHVARARG